MTAKVLAGKPAKQFFINQMQTKMGQLRKKNIKPSLAVILVGNDPVSKIYVKNKHKLADQVGVEQVDYHFANNTTTQNIVELIQNLNNIKLSL